VDEASDRQLELLRLRYEMNQVEPELLEALSSAEAQVDLEFNTFRADLDGRRVSDNDLRDILHHSDNSEKRRHAWEASKEVGAHIAPQVMKLIEQRNLLARSRGYRDYYHMSLALRELDEDRMFAILDVLKRASDQPFQHFKKGLDARQRRRFGLSDSTPLMPWHFDDFFFQELPRDPNAPDLDRLFAPFDPIELSRRFFGALNLEIEPILKVSDLYERPGKSQHAFSTRLNRDGDARILVNLRPTEKWVSTLLHELGHAVYDRYIDLELPWLLRQPAHSLYTEAVALFMGRFSRHAGWLRRYLTDGPLVRDAIEHASYLASAGQLVFLRWALVMVYFERELYRDPQQDLNRLWWKLVRELQGVEVPEGRNRPDWAAKIHLSTVPVYYQNYILGELVASQMEAHLTTEVLSDAANPSDALISDPRVGAWFIDKVFKPGALWHWDRALEVATGHRLNPEHYIRQFLVRPD
jgi:peptidyl-dipeptidase A